MTFTASRCRLAGLVLVATCLATGCSLMNLPYFLLGSDAKHEPSLKKLASSDKNKTVKVAILASSPMEIRPEFIRADRELCTLLAHHLQDGFKENKEKVELVPPRKVEKYKDDHPDWQTMDLAEIGKHFDADYVIYLEINSLNLYERGSGNLMYRGRANISVSVIDVNRSDDDPVSRTFDGVYPSNSKGGVPVDDRSLLEFRQSYLDYVAKHLAWYFTAHSMSDEYSCD